jgi:hypothetical protein
MKILQDEVEKTAKRTDGYYGFLRTKIMYLVFQIGYRAKKKGSYREVY